ncbi:protein-disulfide reductase DsbD [Wenzhouxiangella marina]|uniref:Thiol:disulfide interchange protein DsbD n=1 Tax=Wenzhouxiangella marina TaxID=1579979 RepID=A0A0K0XSV3_9GAMM|nr:protein-disulfide reductase DsbD [Wenzhouxiangella marina]AKS40740.1 thiol:disulfide interchange protein [Wenzhouxiangella marina]MBB6087613.1 thiol:disulfide interchange protein DsbD [Wenzhouxiangella marina]
MISESTLFRLAAAALLALTGSLSQAQISPDDLLPVEEAFALEARGEAGRVVLDFDIADGYYLYRHAFRFESLGEGLRLGEAQIPPGEAGEDEFFGAIETYRDRLQIVLPVEAGAGAAEIAVRFQGCADLGVCYPPHRQTFDLEVASAPAAAPSGLEALLGRPGGTLGLPRQDAGALPEEQAFVYEAIAIDPATILVRMTSAPDYYLYRDKLEFQLDDPEISIAAIEWPPSVSIHDEYFGESEVYYDQVEIPVRLNRPPGGVRSVELGANFMGCLTDGICYPPMSRRLSVELPSASAEELAASAAAIDAGTVDQASAPAAAASEQDRLAQALAGTPVLALMLFLIAGVLLAFTPCVFPMVPILSGLIAGEGEQITTARAFRLSLVYVLAMALVYTAFGVVAGLFGQNLQAVFQHPAVLGGFAALFVVLSLAMFGFYELQLPAALQTRLNAMSNRAEGGTLLGAAIMGALSALVVGPCVAPALMGALIYIGQTGDAVLGGAALFSMAIGMGIPLMIWGTSAGSLLPRAGAWMVAVKAVFGVALLALAIWMLERVLPGALIMLLWGVLALISGVYLGALDGRAASDSGWRTLWRGLGVVLLVLGAAQLVGALSGGSDWTRPLAHLRPVAGGVATSAAAAEFEKVETLEQLEQRIADSQRPVFVDFYADWCVDCVRMERRTFPDPGVARRMAEFTLIKVDVTDYNDAHKEILARFGLIGPPAYLFFRDGEELDGLRMFGFMPPEEFGALLDRVTR